MIKNKVWEALNKKPNWKLLNQYGNEYPMNWNDTINKCLQEPSNQWLFKYNTIGELLGIDIITDNDGSQWTFHIVF